MRRRGKGNDPGAILSSPGMYLYLLTIMDLTKPIHRYPYSLCPVHYIVY